MRNMIAAVAAVCILLFGVTGSFAGQEWSVQDSNRLVQAYRNGEIDEDELAAQAQPALSEAVIEGAFAKAAVLVNRDDFDLVRSWLPAELVDFIQVAADVAGEDSLSAKEKVAALVTSYGGGCDGYVVLLGYCSIIGYLMMLLSLTGIGAIISAPVSFVVSIVSTLGFVAWLLCSIGVI